MLCSLAIRIPTARYVDEQRIVLPQSDRSAHRSTLTSSPARDQASVGESSCRPLRLAPRLLSSDRCTTAKHWAPCVGRTRYRLRVDRLRRRGGTLCCSPGSGSSLTWLSPLGYKRRKKNSSHCIWITTVDIDSCLLHILYHNAPHFPPNYIPLIIATFTLAIRIHMDLHVPTSMTK